MSAATGIRDQEGSRVERCVSLDYGGIRFRLRSRTASLEPTESETGFVEPSNERGIGFVKRCEVLIEAASAEQLPPLSMRQPRWRLGGDGGVLEFAACRAHLSFRNDGTLLVDARGDGTPFTTYSLLATLSAIIAHQAGGLVLHSTGVELDGAGILFVGPSGAGKTTAANLCPGARWIARDRSIVYPEADGWRVWGLAGGTPGDLPRSPFRHVPLVGVLRIRHGRDRPTLDWLDATQAAFVVRESTFSGVNVDEEQCWRAIERLRAAVPIGVLHTVLGRSLLPYLRSHFA